MSVKDLLCAGTFKIHMPMCLCARYICFLLKMWLVFTPTDSKCDFEVDREQVSEIVTEIFSDIAFAVRHLHTQTWAVTLRLTESINFRLTMGQ